MAIRSYVRSTGFCSHYREPIPVCPTVWRENLMCLSQCGLGLCPSGATGVLLQRFTRTSISVQNRLRRVFKVPRDALVIGISKLTIPCQFLFVILVTNINIHWWLKPLVSCFIPGLKARGFQTYRAFL